ncbi:DNA cytosine methyltransferase [Pseudomonas sp. Irchel 3E13]|uniref:DNA cytosine methyltransferase n=1 Tax=Pseudomonas sp. Irchel 3E13 TaxID=2008975 RepID=UPI000BA38A5A|nr:DNA cytosine methyltransferase [Pseudomonas sp. Irchel 3E13]
MTTVINTTIGKAKGDIARLWLEGQKLLHAGVKIGSKYLLRSDKALNRLELVPLPVESAQAGDFTVSKRERNGVISPLLEVRTDLLKTFFEGCEKVRVAIRSGRIVVTALQVDLRIKERVERIKRKLAAKTALAGGSLFHGLGILDKALHTGLLAAGVASFIQVGVELESAYLDASLANNPELWTEDSIAINSDIRDLALSGAVPQLDCVFAGIPCTGASKSGKAKNKLQCAEEHSTAGTLFFDFLDFVKSSNPAICLIENVPDYLDSTSMVVIRSVLTSLGYELHETVFGGAEFGAIEDRKRMVLVAVTRGLEVSFSFPIPGRHSPRKVGDILEDIPLDSPRWKSYDYLAAKEERDIAAGKGFKRQLVTSESATVGTLGRGYFKGRSTEPFLQHPENPELSRLFTGVEHARLKGIPESMVAGMSETIQHEAIGQSVVFNVFVEVGKALGRALTHQAINPDHVALEEEGIDSYCQQVCGGGMCGVEPLCHNGVDATTEMPPKYVPSKQQALALV